MTKLCTLNNGQRTVEGIPKLTREICPSVGAIRILFQTLKVCILFPFNYSCVLILPTHILKKMEGSLHLYTSDIYTFRSCCSAISYKNKSTVFNYT